MLTDLRSILALAEEKGCAIPAFNCYTQECVMGVLEAAKETGAPVIFQMFSRLADTNDGNFVAPAILEAIRQLPQPAVMHLDHGAGIPEVVRAIRLGMTGVMIDASTLPLEENIAMTKLAAELCSYAGVPVEGELGHVGATKDEVLGNYTDVAEAERFVKETGVSRWLSWWERRMDGIKKRLCWISSASATFARRRESCRSCCTAAPAYRTSRSAWQ